jgi:excinuclease ABC subunit C
MMAQTTPDTTALPGSARAAVADLPHAPGVYRFRDAQQRVLYIGRAASLRRRVGSYWTSVGDDRRLANMVKRVARIEAVVCDSEHEAAWLERNLLEQHLPRWNKTAGGQEVPVWIRLSWQSGTPGLAVMHSVQPSPETRHWGPYLGGNKVRLGVAGLHRVMPLAYAGASLSGFEQDLARLRGVNPATRQPLVETLTAVLDRVPATVAAIRADLVARRDAAADSLDFERAARIQAEIDGFEWVVAPQRATVSEADNVDVYGWADGVLVHFQVKSGRLCAWRQQLCVEAAAQRLISTTPETWLEFARRNAEQAARLSRRCVPD